ncbi:MAG: FprA family A-type flavoprotein [Bacteroidia bacterium]|nr:FprA family A-type flavoprotein [Bacteroidia bacterium]
MIDDKILQVTGDVQWIGILDKDIVTFDVVMETKFGTSYNSYFINAERKTIIDTAKVKFKDSYLAKVRKVVNPSEIEYIVMNHTEPDHSGCLEYLLDIAINATVVGSGNAIRYLQDIVGKPFSSLIVKDGDILDLGNKKIRIIGAPNLHWPDTIYTYLEEDKVLFSCDSFGCHYCNDGMFDDKSGDFDEAFNYYFDVILKPFSKFLLKAIEKIRPLDIDLVCPGHGPILRSMWRKYVGLSEKYAREYLIKSNPVKEKVLIAYVSAYEYTGEIARLITDGIRQVGDIETEILNIEHTPLGELDAKLCSATAILVGSPTINQNTLLPVYKLFSMINPLRDKGKPGGAFGSYGWSGEGIKIIEDNLKNLKLKLPVPGVCVKFFPNNENKKLLVDFGRRFGTAVLND